MSFRRAVSAQGDLQGDRLDCALIAIGVRLGGAPAKAAPNLEDTVFSATIEAIEREDYRLLSLVIDWLVVHGARLNVDRMTRLVLSRKPSKLRTLWAAIAQIRPRDSRWERLSGLAPKRQDLLSVGTDFLVFKHGEDLRFKDAA